MSVDAARERRSVTPPENVFMDRWVLEPKTQRVWGAPHATWFTLMGIGGGLFILARALDRSEQLGHWFGIPLVDWISFIAIAVGGLILIGDLGRPWRAWRAFVNVRRSVISWGAWADLVFLLTGTLLVLPDLTIGSARPFESLPWDSEATAGTGRLLEILAMVAAVVVMVYAGVVLARPRAIPYWHAASIPLQFLLSSAATALSIVFVMELANDVAIDTPELWIQVAFLAVLLGLVVGHLMTKRDAPGKRESLDRLLHGQYRLAFVGGVIVVGTVLPLCSTVVALAATDVREAFAIVTLVLLLPAGFALRLLTLRVGIFPPMRDVVGIFRP
jgi:formate-dependent nitrite reductase membrane component NrfD